MDKLKKTKQKQIHNDLTGRVTRVSEEGHKYAVVSVDYYSGALGVYFVKKKGNAVRATEQFLADTIPFCTVKRLGSDNGGECIKEKLKSLLLKNLIKQETWVPSSPHQNGTAERAWKSILDMSRYEELPKQFWAYTVMTSAHNRNRCYKPKTGKIPYECFIYKT